MRRHVLCLLVGLIISSISTTVRADKSPYQWALIRLDETRREKVEQFERFCARIHDLALKAGHDDALAEFLDVNAKYAAMSRAGQVPDGFTRRITEFRAALTDYYINHYLAFYDVLFIDAQGNVVHSMRRESDAGGNLCHGELATTPLGECLRAHPRDERFVDFHDYTPSDEPAAFFVEPISRDGQHIGWLALQCAVNKINSLFAGIEQLGQTGEAFVVNRDGFMLTESSFCDSSTILKTHLDSNNVEPKFQQGQGHRRVIDYRGFPALTSFEVVEMLGTQWLVVAKVDEAQVTTEHYRQHRSYYATRLIDHLTKLPPCHPTGHEEHHALDDWFPTDGDARKVIRVDMDEFVRANHGELLQTLGVSTCTAVVATYPGKFGYLAHISPCDRVYGRQATNLLGHVAKKIKTYDIYKFERRKVEFLVVARHCNSLANIVNKLVDEGFMLSQISIIYNPNARCANVAYDYSDGRVSVQWLPEQASAGGCVHHADDAHNVGEIVRSFVDG